MNIKNKEDLTVFPPLEKDKIKIKVCGMKYAENIEQIAQLQPDYLGFIFYAASKRNFEGSIGKLPKSIKKTGVFVNESVEIVISMVKKHRLDAIQLHGDESVEYIKELKKRLKYAQIKIEIIKVFGIKSEFDFSLLKPYEQEVDFFLFDTKAKERGGNGIKFNWSVLEKYPYKKPFFLSGGIGLDESKKIKNIVHSKLPIYGLDINSQFEKKPGLKKVEDIKKFKKSIDF